jgi:hypothetical protein
MCRYDRGPMDNRRVCTCGRVVANRSKESRPGVVCFTVVTSRSRSNAEGQPPSSRLIASCGGLDSVCPSSITILGCICSSARCAQRLSVSRALVKSASGSVVFGKPSRSGWCRLTAYLGRTIGNISPCQMFHLDSQRSEHPVLYGDLPILTSWPRASTTLSVSRMFLLHCNSSIIVQ